MDFAKDLFLPTFINRALKVDGLASKIFTSIGAIALDLFTFIPRLIATPFRIDGDRYLEHNNEWVKQTSFGISAMNINDWIR